MTDRTDRRARVEVLFFEGCPHWAATVSLVREVAGELGVDAEVREVEVGDAAQAERLRFPGSPTVRVNGADIEREAAERSDYAPGCRMYGRSGVPPREMLAEALRASGSSRSRRIP